MIFSTIAGVVFLPISVQSAPAWKSKWTPRKASARFMRRGGGVSEAGADKAT
jgi:hypothetical protein